MSKTQLVMIFTMIFRMLHAIMIMNSKTVQDEKETYSLMADAQNMMQKVIND